MKTLFSVLVCGFLFYCMVWVAPNRADSRSRCVNIKPVCPIGKNPICICEDEITISKCGWICADLGALQELPDPDDDECGDDPLCPLE